MAKERTATLCQTAQELARGTGQSLAMKDAGGWLRKAARQPCSSAGAVRLDPVAREKRPGEATWSVRKTNIDVASGELTPGAAIAQHAGEGDENLLRPRRLPQRESGPRESAFGTNEAPGQTATEPVQKMESSGARAKTAKEFEPVAQGELGEHAIGLVTGTSESGTGASKRVADGRSSAGKNAAPQTATEQMPEAREEQSALQPMLSANDTPRVEASHRRRRFTVGLVILLVLAGAVVYELVRGSFAQVVLRPGDAVLLAPIENRTGDADLDRSVMQGFEIELTENSTLHFDGLSSFRAGRRQIQAQTGASERSITTQAVAERIGARAYLYGELVRNNSGYTLTINVVDAASNDRMASLSESCAAKEGIATVVTDLSVALRKRLGEGDGVQARAPTPLARQATNNMAALEAYAEAGLAVEEGRLMDGVVGYRSAAALAPNFTLALVRSAWLAELEGAEVEAAEAATEAQKNAGRAGDRVGLMAKYTRQALTDRDLTAATATARGMNASRPVDPESLLALARVMRLGGHMTEALLSAEQATRRGPFDVAALNEQAHALIGLDRYADALHLESAASASGLVCSCGRGAATYLSGDTAIVADRGEPAPVDLARLTESALANDNSARWEEGLRLWRQAAATAQEREGLGSAAGSVLAQAALDRALADRCTDAIALEMASANLLHGSTATFRNGVAHALCDGATGNADQALAKNAALHSEIAEVLLPALRAADALHARAPMQALGELSGVREQRDASPLVLYLRGMAHLAGKQNDLATNDFAAIAAHRGRAFLSGSAVYGPALAGLLRVRLETGDKPGAEQARLLMQQAVAESPGAMVANRGRSDDGSRSK